MISGMNAKRQLLKPVLTAVFLSGAVFSGPAGAQDVSLDDLFDALRESDPSTSEAIESKIWEEWSKSGSPAMDLLLERGREAMAAGDTALAIHHLTALIDHAPGFAEGYNARATAYFQAQMIGPSLADIQQALKLNPRHFGALSGLAMILEDLGYEKDALEAWREVQRLSPHRQGAAESVRRLESKLEGQTL